MPLQLWAFVVKAFKEWTGLTVNDLYTGNHTLEYHQEIMYYKQLTRLLEKYNTLQEKLGGLKLCLEEVGEQEAQVPKPHWLGNGDMFEA